jgi:ankyrin repeat protein
MLNRLLLLMDDKQCSTASLSSGETASFVWTVDIEDNSGCTPLWEAAYCGYSDCVDILLMHGASPDHKDKNGKSPLDRAEQFGHATIVSKMTESRRNPSNADLAMKNRVTSARTKEMQSLREERLVHLVEIENLCRKLSEKDRKLLENAEKINILESLIKQG